MADWSGSKNVFGSSRLIDRETIIPNLQLHGAARTGKTRFCPHTHGYKVLVDGWVRHFLRTSAGGRIRAIAFVPSHLCRVDLD
jgi:hypothetical protein